MNKFKQILSKLPLFQEFRNWRFRSFPPKSTPQYWVNKYLKNSTGWAVQIGANDGAHNDPINRIIKKNDRWQCLFVEPVPYVFDRLKKNYGQNKRFHFELSAINDGVEQVFYYVDKNAKTKIDSLPYWFDQLGSFNKHNITNHIPELEPFVRELSISGTTLDVLFKKYQVVNLQLLHIDTEGYDFKILKQLNLDLYSPIVILFEHSHMDSYWKNESKLLLGNRYFMFDMGTDFLCIEKIKFARKDFKYLKTF